MWAQQEPGLEERRAPEAPAARLGERLQIEALAALPPAWVAESEKLEVLRAHNLAGRPPTRVGIERPLPATIRVAISAQLLRESLPRAYAGGVLDVVDDERLVWAARIELQEAFGFRVLVEAPELPETARIWVYEDGGRLRGPVGVKQQVDGRLWTPTVFTPSGVVELDVPLSELRAGKRVELELRKVGEIFRLDDRGAPLTGPDLEPQSAHCFVDAMCRDSGDLSFIEDYRKAVANLIFPVSGGFATCTGGLLNTATGPQALLLTASHCLNAPESAAGLDAYWDHQTDTCDGTNPGLGNVPSTSGSTLLASSPDTDFTLVEITGTLPPNRYHLGWTTASLAHGTTLYRIHNPGTDPQHYSRGTVDHTGPIECSGIPRPRFLYSQLVEGAQRPGSSGSVVVIDAGGGQVVGQLLGVCGSNLSDRCDYVNNRTVDGAFEYTHFTTRQWVDPAQSSSNDVAFPLAGFTLSGGQSTVRDFTCQAADAGDVIAFSFRGTAAGLSPVGSFASDLRLQLTGPSGSTFDVGGFPFPTNDWAFQGWSDADGTYVSSHITRLSSNPDGTTICQGGWTATFSNDFVPSGPVTWSDVSIILHKVGVPCPFSDHLVPPGQTVTDTQVFQACRTITAGSGNFVVASTGDVTFRAGERIILESGFSVASGGKFVAEIDPSLAP